MKDTWVKEGLTPCLISGFFAGWIKLHFLTDLAGGVWGGQYTYGAEYYLTSTAQGFSNLPTQFLMITLVAATMAVATLNHLKQGTWYGQITAMIAFATIIGSIVYACISYHREVFFAEGTRKLIWTLESRKNLSSWDETKLQELKKLYKIGATQRNW